MLDVGDKVSSLVASFFGLVALALALRDVRSTVQRSKEASQRTKIALLSLLDVGTENIGQATLRRMRDQVDEPTGDRISRISQALQESQDLIAELQSEMDTKVVAVKRLRAEEEQSRQLAALREEEAQAVRSLIGATIESAHRELQLQMERERADQQNRLRDLQDALTDMQKSGKRDQLRFFIYGAGVSIPIGILINVFF